MKKRMKRKKKIIIKMTKIINIKSKNLNKGKKSGKETARIILLLKFYLVLLYEQFAASFEGKKEHINNISIIYIPILFIQISMRLESSFQYISSCSS